MKNPISLSSPFLSPLCLLWHFEMNSSFIDLKKKKNLFLQSPQKSHKWLQQKWIKQRAWSLSSTIDSPGSRVWGARVVYLLIKHVGCISPAATSCPRWSAGLLCSSLSIKGTSTGRLLPAFSLSQPFFSSSARILPPHCSLAKHNLWTARSHYSAVRQHDSTFSCTYSVSQLVIGQFPAQTLILWREHTEPFGNRCYSKLALRL